MLKVLRTSEAEASRAMSTRHDATKATTKIELSRRIHASILASNPVTDELPAPPNISRRKSVQERDPGTESRQSRPGEQSLLLSLMTPPSRACCLYSEEAAMIIGQYIHNGVERIPKYLS